MLIELFHVEIQPIANNQIHVPIINILGLLLSG
jgi:hypothetical protein